MVNFARGQKVVPAGWLLSADGPEINPNQSYLFPDKWCFSEVATTDQQAGNIDWDLSCCFGIGFLVFQMSQKHNDMLLFDILQHQECFIHQMKMQFYCPN